MNNKLLINTIGLAFIIFGSSLYLTNYVLGRESVKIITKQREAELSKFEIPQDFKSSLEEFQTDPSKRELGLGLAKKLRERAAIDSKTDYLVYSLTIYQKILEYNSNDAEALLGLAELSSESGVFDKAKEYYEKYLILNPNNPKAKTDLALTILQLGDTDIALAKLTEINKAYPENFSSELGLALAYKIKGDVESSKSFAKLALNHAPSDEGKQVVLNFLQQFEVDNKNSKITASKEELVKEFFINHSVIGKKIIKIDWIDSNNVKIIIDNFPFDAMPDFAKKKLSANVQDLIKRTGSNELIITLYDDGQKRDVVKYSGD